MKRNTQYNVSIFIIMIAIFLIGLLSHVTMLESIYVTPIEAYNEISSYYLEETITIPIMLVDILLISSLLTLPISVLSCIIKFETKYVIITFVSLILLISIFYSASIYIITDFENFQVIKSFKGFI